MPFIASSLAWHIKWVREHINVPLQVGHSGFSSSSLLTKMLFPTSSLPQKSNKFTVHCLDLSSYVQNDSQGVGRGWLITNWTTGTVQKWYYPGAQFILLFLIRLLYK